MDIPFYYDPMIAKLICRAESREAAIKKMIRVIDEYEITGLETTLGFCRLRYEPRSLYIGKF
jgi:propionyl-CoA carboxylase alpha chain